MADQQPDSTPEQTPDTAAAPSPAAPEAPVEAPHTGIHDAGAVTDGEAYDAGSITVLEGLEAVRKRPGMYIGSTGERGLHHLVWEIVDNAVDEALAGYADTIDVTLMENGAVRVKDNGRGIPTDMHPTEGVSAVELVLTQLHAGGKFGGGGYKVSGGLHGVGSSVVNALSTRLDVCVRQKGHAFRMSFEHGVPVAPLEMMEETDRTGTTITYWANDQIFATVDYDYETIRARFQQMAFLNKGLTINLVDERVEATASGSGEPDLDGVDADIAVVEDHEDEGAGGGVKKTTARSVSYRYENGLVDYVNHLVSSKKSDPVHSDVIAIEVEDAARSLSLELAMQWTTSYSESVHTYANTINTHEGGTHEEGFRAALTKLVNDFARKQNQLKDKDDNLTGDDVREGLTAVISVKLGEPQFEGQTKTKLGNSEVKGFVQRAMTDEFGGWLDSHPNEGKEIVGIAEIINVPGHVNVDFEDVRTVMGEPGKAMMGTALANGPDRARIAAEQAVACPLLEGIDLSGAKGVLVLITAAKGSLKLSESKLAMNTIRAYASPDAHVIYGTAYDDALGEDIRVTVVATGLSRHGIRRTAPPLQVLRTGTDNVPVHVPALNAQVNGVQVGGAASMGVSQPDYAGMGTPAVWRGRTSAAAKVDALSNGGMDDYEIPAFLRKQAD